MEWCIFIEPLPLQVIEMDAPECNHKNGHHMDAMKYIISRTIYAFYNEVILFRLLMLNIINMNMKRSV